MLKVSVYITLFSGVAFFLSCISIFGWEKTSKVSAEFVDRVSPKLRGWERASRASSGLAPLPETNQEAVVQAYAAALWGLRGLVADHTWVSTKSKEASAYTVYEVIGWRMMKGYNSFLRMEQDIPDRLWFGKKPRVLIDLRGEEAEQIIDKIHTAASRYPYKNEYSMVFGPNSNTFTAWISCQVPELNLKLSHRAIGKGYLKNCQDRKSINFTCVGCDKGLKN